MQLAGPDIMVSEFQVDVIVVTENLFTERTLQRAAERLLIAWPFLSFRTNLTVRVQTTDRKVPFFILTPISAYCTLEACR